MRIDLRNCNNITEGAVEVEPNHLNICYAMNGSGKSTVARAIKMTADGDGLAELQPFGSDESPNVEFSNNISSVLVFNEEFVNNIVFVESDVIKDAFDIFIKSPEYDAQRAAIEDRLQSIREEAISTSDLDTLRKTGHQVLSKFKQTKSGDLAQQGLLKSLVSTESIFELPEKIGKFQPMMQRHDTIEWVGWKIHGYDFDDQSMCPFCTTPLPDDYDEEKTEFKRSYSKSNVKNVREMLDYFEEVKGYMDAVKREHMEKCLRDSKDPEQIKQVVKMFYYDLKYLVERIDRITQFTAFEIRKGNIADLVGQLRQLHINTDDLHVFKNEIVLSIVDEINSRVQGLIEKADGLKKQLGKLNGLITRATDVTIKDMNQFLRLADIKYQFGVRQESDDTARAYLEYVPESADAVEVKDLRRHLSWGERNAFALVLFMHYAQNQAPDLVVLDDPISSFDANKKYAIISRLFSNRSGEKSFYGSTVLMLTHDFQPIIDFVVNNKPHGNGCVAFYYWNSRGILLSQSIEKRDVQSFPKLLARNAKREDLNKVHRVASLRKLFEHTRDDQEAATAYALLSCLLHGKEHPTSIDGTPLDQTCLLQAEYLIQEYIPDFAYPKYYNEVFTSTKLIEQFKNETNSYYKLQVFRVLTTVLGLRSKLQEKTLLKYVDEQFHIENDYMFFLDYAEFELVPSFVLSWCEEFLRSEGVI